MDDSGVGVLVDISVSSSDSISEISSRNSVAVIEGE